MSRTKVFLTLNLPDKGLASGIPVVASFEPRLLRLFKQTVLEEWDRRATNAEDAVLAQVDRLEFRKLKDTLDLLIPEGEGEDDGLFET